MENLRISTWNIKSSCFRLSKNYLKAAAVIQLLNDCQLDILALQGVNSLLAKRIEENLQKLGSTYQINSSYQKTCNPIKNLRVQYNMIISRFPSSLNNTTIFLPSGLSRTKQFKFWKLRKQNMVIQVLQNGLIMNVTNLNHTPDELWKQQMDEVMDIISSQKRVIGHDSILMGNLNKTPIEKKMIEISEELAENCMQILENSHKTNICYSVELPVDYIIVPENWQVKSVKTLENYDDISTHRPIVAKVKKR